MSCAHGWLSLGPEGSGEGGGAGAGGALEGERETVLTLDASSVSFGRGALLEVGELVRGLGARRVGIVTDPRVRALEPYARVKASLDRAGVGSDTFAGVRVEPTDASFLEAAAFARDGRFDAYVSVGGGSTMDTCKAAMLYATYPAEFLTYVNRPVGAGQPVPGPLPPHVACPTTSGTGSELTGIAICDVVALAAKTGIASRRLRPTFAVIDPDVTASLPSGVVAASGFDVLCHALESFTARPFTARPRSASPAARPMSQGRNPWSDLGSREALRLGGAYLVRGARDAEDREAREALLWASALAGFAFGNAGVHVPHGMAYAVAGLAHAFRMRGYEGSEPFVPHGVSVVVNAPAVFRLTAATSPERHLEAAALLGADVRGAAPEDAGEVLAEALVRLMREAEVPLDLGALGLGAADVERLVETTLLQRRLLDNAPIDVDASVLEGLFEGSLSPAVAPEHPAAGPRS